MFVDIDPATFNIDPALIEPAVTRRTKAIMPVHLFGQMADMDPIMRLAGQARWRSLRMQRRPSLLFTKAGGPAVSAPAAVFHSSWVRTSAASETAG